MFHQPKKVGILVGGGPAPGINAVIGAATIRAVLSGFDVVGINDGFNWIMQGNIDHVKPLGIGDVSRIHFRGGSALGISRANPTKSPALLEAAIVSLLRLDVDKLVGAIVKRLASGRPDGVAVLAEGIVEHVDPQDLAELDGVERDAHGHIRIAEIAFGEILKEKVQKRLAQWNVKATIVAKNIGYELRCADPIPYDMEYARDLGYCASKFLTEGGNAAMVCVTHSMFQALPFDSIMDRKTGRVRVRMVDIDSDRYMIARRYMLRLRKDDFDDPSEIAKFASVLGITIEQFHAEFAGIVADEPIPRSFAGDAGPVMSRRPPSDD